MSIDKRPELRIITMTKSEYDLAMHLFLGPNYKNEFRDYHSYSMDGFSEVFFSGMEIAGSDDLGTQYWTAISNDGNFNRTNRILYELPESFDMRIFEKLNYAYQNAITSKEWIASITGVEIDKDIISLSELDDLSEKRDGIHFTDDTLANHWDYGIAFIVDVLKSDLEDGLMRNLACAKFLDSDGKTVFHFVEIDEPIEKYLENLEQEERDR